MKGHNEAYELPLWAGTVVMQAVVALQVRDVGVGGVRVYHVPWWQALVVRWRWRRVVDSMEVESVHLEHGHLI